MPGTPGHPRAGRRAPSRYAIHPRAALINHRTMEIFRSVGIELMVGEKSGQQFDQDGAIMAVETFEQDADGSRSAVRVARGGGNQPD